MYSYRLMTMGMEGARSITMDMGNVSIHQNYMVALPDGPLKNFHLGAGYEIPLYQQLEGIQMKTKSLLTFGVQCSFKAKKEKEK